ncbi:response regulator transcription factor [Paraburkholderia dipogonis]|uniref:Response regulator transcription factor n=1 Tax=Paraburkholderia dipogonis TaxID=1211383 RepID=A0A4Y8MWZ8_9BURK|nr:response regulator transcription factor [Paraburkholderia dipogonis]TFE41921.1 response regulator transcription factor [Paraburkholderia dipogonis]
MKQVILVVDADATCRDELRGCLQSNGFDVAVLYDPDKVVRRVEVERPALITMTNSTSYGRGLVALRTIRARGDDVPIIMLGERDDVVDRIVALDCGADDFISKPFDAYELLLRVRSVLRRAVSVPLDDPALKPPFSFNGFKLDFASRTLTFLGEPVPLPQNEYAILNMFSAAPHQVLSKQVIAQYIRPGKPFGAESVGVWVHRLRKRIEFYNNAERLIHTIHSRGYVFRPETGDRRRELQRDEIGC